MRSADGDSSSQPQFCSETLPFFHPGNRLLAAQRRRRQNSDCYCLIGATACLSKVCRIAALLKRTARKVRLRERRTRFLSPQKMAIWLRSKFSTNNTQACFFI